jgi:hypothetical protein
LITSKANLSLFGELDQGGLSYALVLDDGAAIAAGRTKGGSITKLFSYNEYLKVLDGIDM